jgi:hypothetical protein
MTEKTENITIFEKVFREVTREFIFDQETEDFIRPYARKVLNARNAHILSNLPKDITPEKGSILNLREILDAMNKAGQMETLVYTNEIRQAFYEKTYKAFREALSANLESWQDLFTEIVNEDYMHEIFVSLVEEEEKVKITSAKQLQEATGITHIYGYWDEEQGKTLPYEENAVVTEKEAQAEAYKQVEETFIKAMQFRYEEALIEILRSGGKYKDLLEVKPSFFYVSEDYKETAIKRSVSLRFELWDTSRLKPDIGSIADKINAPYSFVLTASKQPIY